jgi:serine/threonine-protein kinase PknK
VPSWKRARTAGAPAGPGEHVPGYSDLHRIGHGGFSVVYRAHHAGLDRVVALKVLTVEFIDAQIRRGLLREVQLAGRLSGHPNVVTVLDSGMTGSGRPYIAMDFYERGSVRDRLAAEGPLPLGEVLRIGIKIAGALAAAHHEGILHRDVKPQNILMSRYGEPALADFGTARLTAELDASSRTEALTPFHAAPEVLEGHPPAAAADVYSLGSTMYQMLAGRPAFQRDADFGIAPLLLRILTEELPPISRPDVPEPVSAVIRQAMHRDPAQRYESAEALVAALRQQQQALGLQATEPAGVLADLTGPPPRPAQAGPAQGGPAQAGPAQAGPAQAGPAQAGPAQGGPAQAVRVALGARSVPQPPAPGLPPPDITLPPITATPWDFAEKTGYRPAAVPPAQPGDGVPASQARAPRAEPAPDAVTTVPRHPPEEPPAAPPAPRRPAGFRALIVGAICVAALVAVTVPLLLAGRHGRKHVPPAPAPSAPAAPSTPAGASPEPAATAAPGVARRATPVGLTVRVLGSGSAAILRWRLRHGNDYPLIVDQVQPAGATLVPLTIGTTSYTATGLRAGLVYCFRVGAVTALGSQAGQAEFAWSNTACTNG